MVGSQRFGGKETQNVSTEMGCVDPGRNLGLGNGKPFKKRGELLLP